MVLLSPRDAARRLNLSVSRVTQLSREGRLPTVRDSMGRRLFDPRAVETLAAARGQSGEAPHTQTQAGSNSHASQQVQAAEQQIVTSR